MTETLRGSYDELPYQTVAFPPTHPDRLATLAWLFGLAPPPVERCRVLEIGCATGGNLIPMAATLPRSEFVGIDFSAVQIEQAAADVAALGLGNVRLLHMDVRGLDDRLGSFDYIVAHGVYSWTPTDAQEALLDICSRRLAPDGIAYVSYNTLPGWRSRGVVREAMLFHTRHASDARTRIREARAVLDFLAEALHGNTSAYAAMLREEALYVRGQPDHYVLHDYLEEVNEPLYFHQFMERAARHGLRYLAEADFRSMLGRELAPHVQQALARTARDLLEREQILDFIHNRSFRETLLVRHGAALTRNLSPERVFALHVATRAKPVRDAPDETSAAAEVFHAPDGSYLTTQRPFTKAAMMALAQASPAAIAFDELCRRASERLGARGAPSPEERGALASDLLYSFASGVVELHACASPFVVAPGPLPEASPVARLQAARGARVTSLRHEPVDLAEELRRLLALLDGTRAQEALAAMFSPGEPEETALRRLQPALESLARHALLVG